MFRQLIFVLCVFTLLGMPACKKKDTAEVPAPVAPPVVTDTATELKPDTTPNVTVDTTPDELAPFDPSRYRLEDVYFDFDQSDLRPDTIEALNRYATVLRSNPTLEVLVEGHCDERGTDEYNLGLGERRSQRVKEYLISVGIDASRLRTISYGESRPVEMGSNEAAWAKNRRAHFVLSQ